MLDDAIKKVVISPDDVSMCICTSNVNLRLRNTSFTFHISMSAACNDNKKCYILINYSIIIMIVLQCCVVIKVKVYSQ